MRQNRMMTPAERAQKFMDELNQNDLEYLKTKKETYAKKAVRFRIMKMQRALKHVPKCSKDTNRRQIKDESWQKYEKVEYDFEKWIPPPILDDVQSDFRGYEMLSQCEDILINM